jgi:hypothetical protein
LSLRQVKSEGSAPTSLELKRKRKYRIQEEVVPSSYEHDLIKYRIHDEVVPSSYEQDLNEIINKLKNENLSYHWQNNELKCENRRLQRLNEENQESHKAMLIQYEDMKKSVLEQKVKLQQLKEENTFLMSLIPHGAINMVNRNPFSKFPITPIAPERDPMNTPLNLPPIASLFEQTHKSNISGIMD